ncbi:DUF4253 domain-containing protein [Longispora urticae]
MTDQHLILSHLADDLTGRRLGLSLPAGQLIYPEDDTDSARSEPAYWLSDNRPTIDQIPKPAVGLWPLLLAGSSHNPDRPWVDGEVAPGMMIDSDTFDAETVLAQMWADATDIDGEDDHLTREERLAVTAPFDDQWPGLAPAGTPTYDPDSIVADYIQHLLDDGGLHNLRLGLIPATRAADTITAAGWTGPCNYDNNMAKYSAVLRSWEERFGARVVAVGFDTLHVAVAAPPTTIEHALHIAAEHFAFCPDNIWQGRGDLHAYAEAITGVANWEFWWD